MFKLNLMSNKKMLAKLSIMVLFISAVILGTSNAFAQFKSTTIIKTKKQNNFYHSISLDDKGQRLIRPDINKNQDRLYTTNSINNNEYNNGNGTNEYNTDRINELNKQYEDLAIRSKAKTSTPSINSYVEVAGDLVNIGDLITNAGTFSNIALFRAPSPGNSGIVSIKRLARKLAKYNLDWQNPYNIPHITIRRKSVIFDQSSIRDLVKSQLISTGSINNTSSLNENYKLNINNSTSVHLPINSNNKPQIVNFNYDDDSGKFSATIETHKNDKASNKLNIKGSLVELIKIPVFTNGISKGDIINESMIGFKEVDKNKFQDKFIHNIDNLIGQTAKANINANQPIKSINIAPTKLVTKNSVVVVNYHTGGFKLSITGKAKQDGVLDEVIAIENLQSKQVIQARVTAKNTVVPAVLSSN